MSLIPANDHQPHGNNTMILKQKVILSITLTLFMASYASGADFSAMTCPLPPYSINKGLNVQGIAVDTLTMIMTLSGVPMTSEDVKLMLGRHAAKITAEGPAKIMLNAVKTEKNTPKFKWVGPYAINRLVVVGKKGGPTISGLDDLNQYKTSTVRRSLPAQDLIEAGVSGKSLVQFPTCLVPLKDLKNDKVNFFAFYDSAATYMMQTLDMRMDNYKVMLTYREEPLYFAFSKDTPDNLIAKLNTALEKLKQPDKNGKSRYDRIVAKYLPHGLLQ